MPLETGFQRGVGGGFRSSVRIMLGLLAMRGLSTAARAFAFRNRAVLCATASVAVPFAPEALCFNLSHCAPERVKHETALNKDVCDRSASELAWSCVAEMMTEKKTKKCRLCDQAYSGGPVCIKAHILSSCSNMVEVLTDEFRAPAAQRAMMQLQLGGGIPRPRAPIT